MSELDQLADVYDNYVRIYSGNPGAQNLEVSLTSLYVPSTGEPYLQLVMLSSSGNNVTWTKQDQSGGLALPPPLAEFNNLSYTHVEESKGTMSKLASGGSSPSGLRYDLRTFAFYSSSTMLKRIKQIFDEEFAPISKEIAGFSGVIEWQIVTENAIAQGVAHGGNVPGFKGGGPVIR
jgi:hypothetical protein